MKYQDFSRDENILSTDDGIFIFHMCRQGGCHDYFNLSQSEITITVSRAFPFFIHKSVALKNTMEFSNELPININIFDDEQSDRVDALSREISSWRLEDKISYPRVVI